VDEKVFALTGRRTKLFTHTFPMHPMSVFVSSLIKYMSIKTSFSEYPQNTKHSKMNVDLDVYLFEYQ